MKTTIECEKADLKSLFLAEYIYMQGYIFFDFTVLPRDAMLSAVYAVVVCLCVCLSVTLRYCIKTAKRRITQITPHDSPMTLVQVMGQWECH